MNRKGIYRGIAALFAMLVVFGLATAVSQASILASLLQNGQNVLKDESGEKVFDADGSLSITVGDVIWGAYKIGNNGSTSLDNQLYLVVAQQIDTFVGNHFTMKAVDPISNPLRAGYTLNTWTGRADINAGAMVAVFDKATGFSNDVNGISVPLASLILSLNTEGVFEASFGISQPGDFFEGDALYTSGFSLATLYLVPPTTPLGSYVGGLTVLQNNATDVVFNDANYFFLNPTPYEAIVTLGSFSGANAPEINADYDIINKTNVVVNATIVPEPASLAVWSLLAGAVGLVRLRRRR